MPSVVTRQILHCTSGGSSKFWSVAVEDRGRCCGTIFPGASTLFCPKCGRRVRSLEGGETDQPAAPGAGARFIDLEEEED